MTNRVSDSALAARIRRQNRVHSKTRRERLVDAGQVQLMTWIPGAIREEIDRIAAARQTNLSETITALLTLGLERLTTLEQGHDS